MEIIRRHHLLDVVTSVAGPISIARGTLDDFIDRADKGELLVGRYKDNHTNGNEVLVPGRVHPAHIDVRRTACDWLISSARVRAAIGPPGLARRLAAMLPSRLTDQFQDEMLIAAQTGHLLLSDDLGYRRFAGSVGLSHRAGIAAVFRVALVQGAIDLTRYVAAIAALGRARHRFIATDSEDLAEAFKQDGGTVGTVTRGVANLLGGTGANLTVQWEATSSFLKTLWRDEAKVPHRLDVATLLADRFLAGAPVARRAFSKGMFENPDHALSCLERSVASAITELTHVPT